MRDMKNNIQKTNQCTFKQLLTHILTNEVTVTVGHEVRRRGEVVMVSEDNIRKIKSCQTFSLDIWKDISGDKLQELIYILTLLA